MLQQTAPDHLFFLIVAKEQKLSFVIIPKKGFELQLLVIHTAGHIGSTPGATLRIIGCFDLAILIPATSIRVYCHLFAIHIPYGLFASTYNTTKSNAYQRYI
jgi:hypothetical protein